MSIKKASKKRSFWNTSVGNDIIEAALGVSMIALSIAIIAFVIWGVCAISDMIHKAFPTWTDDDIFLVTVGILIGSIASIALIYNIFVFIKYILATLRTLKLPLTKEEIKEYNLNSILDYSKFIEKEARYLGGRHVSIFEDSKRRLNFIIDTINLYLDEVLNNPVVFGQYIDSIEFMFGPYILINKKAVKNLVAQIKNNFSDLNKINFYGFDIRNMDISVDICKKYVNSKYRFINYLIPLGFVYDETKLCIFYNDDLKDKEITPDVLVKTFDFDGEEMNDEFFKKCLEEVIMNEF